MKRSLFFILTIVTIFTNACGNNDYANGTGAAAFHVVWLSSAELAPNIYRTAPSSVLTVRVIVTAPDMATMQNDFPAPAGVGTVHGIPAGANRTFTIQGLDANLTPIYQGEAYSISIVAGQVSDCGTVNLAPVTSSTNINPGTNPGTNTGTVTTVPTMPTMVTATAGNGQVTISWTSVPGATFYNIYWNTTGAVTKSSGTKITNIATNSYIHAGLTNGTAYWYAVTAVNSYGESPESMAPYGATPGVAPAAPTGVAAVAGDGQVSISWTSIQGVTAYYVYWSTTPGVTKNSTNKLFSPGAMNFTHTGVSNGITYYYVVTAASGGAAAAGQIESVASAEVSATPKAGATSPLTVSASNVTDTSATINGSFTNSSGYTTTAWMEYGPTTAYGSSSGQTAYTQTGNITIPSISLTGLTEHATYHYRTVTQNSGGTFYSADNTFTTLYIARTLASGLTQPSIIVYDASSSSLFFTQNTSPNGTISKISTSGTTSATTIISSLVNPTILAIDAANVYWVDNDAGGSSTYQIKKALKTGGTPTTLATGISSPYAIAVDAANVYWTENVNIGGAVKKVSLSGGPVTTLAAGQTSPRGLAIDSASVYWTENGQSIKKVGINSGTPTVLVGLSYSGALADSIVLDQSYIYFIGETGAAMRYLQKLNINGGSPVSITMLYSSAFILDASDIYNYFSSIQRISLTDGTITLLATGSATPTGAAVDSTNIYWTDLGRILYVPKN